MYMSKCIIDIHVIDIHMIDIGAVDVRVIDIDVIDIRAISIIPTCCIDIQVKFTRHLNIRFELRTAHA